LILGLSLKYASLEYHQESHANITLKNQNISVDIISLLSVSNFEISLIMLSIES